MKILKIEKKVDERERSFFHFSEKTWTLFFFTVERKISTMKDLIIALTINAILGTHFYDHASYILL